MKLFDLFSKKTSGLGLDLGSTWLKMVRISPHQDGCTLKSVARCPWQPGDSESNAATAKRIQTLWAQFGLKDSTAISSLAGHAVIVKRVLFEAESAADLRDVIYRDARQYIPFDINDVFLDFQVLGAGDKATSHEVLLVASKKKVVENLSDIISQSNISLSIIDVDCFALCNSFEFNYPEFYDQPVYLLDIGGEQSVFCIYDNGQPMFMREVPFGGRLITEIIAKICGLSQMDAERLKLNGPTETIQPLVPQITDEISAKLVSWCEELHRLIGFYQASSSTARPAQHMFISGGGAMSANLCAIFQKELRINVQFHNPFRRANISDTQFDLDYLHAIAPQMVVPFGLSLRGIATAGPS